MDKKRKENHDYCGWNDSDRCSVDDDETHDFLTLTLPLQKKSCRLQCPTPEAQQEEQQESLYFSERQPQQSLLFSQLQKQRKQPQQQQQLPSPPLQLSASHPLNAPAGALAPPLHHPMMIPVAEQPVEVPTARPRARRNTAQAPKGGKSATVLQPFPWATDKRATIYTMAELESKRITRIHGDVQCKRCERQYEMGYDLKTKLLEVVNFICKYRETMHDRAPQAWMNPVLPKCRFCEQENSVKPVIAEKKKAINWLFLLLGQLLGCCTLEQLKYFCKHTKNHRTGAKDRVLYLAYLGLCKQLYPEGPFNR